MGLWNRPLRFVVAGSVLALLYVSWVFSNRWAVSQGSARYSRKQGAANAAFNTLYGSSNVKILQFYARDGVVTQGQGTVLCYGVLNAKSVHIDPPVETVRPSLNTCVEVKPLHHTRYTLTAHGTDGGSVSETLSVKVVPDSATIPAVTDFRIASRDKDYTGQPVFLLTFSTKNAEQVSIDPPVFPPLHRSQHGHFYVNRIQPQLIHCLWPVSTGKSPGGS